MGDHGSDERDVEERHLKRTEGETSKVGSVEEKFNGPNDERFSDVELDFGISGDNLTDNGLNRQNIGVHNRGMCNATEGESSAEDRVAAATEFGQAATAPEFGQEAANQGFGHATTCLGTEEVKENQRNFKTTRRSLGER